MLKFATLTIRNLGRSKGLLPNSISLRRVALASHGEEGEKEKTTPLQGRHPGQSTILDQDYHCGSKHEEHPE